jgi:hypothetical protein
MMIPNAPRLRRPVWGLMAFLWLVGSAGPARPAAQDGPEVRPAFFWTAEVEGNSRYLWRGIPWSDGFVVQPSAMMSWRGWSFGLWSNFDGSSGRDVRGFNELDFYFSYTKEWPGLTIEPGINVFTYPGQGGDDPATVEAALRLTAPLAGPVSVFLEQALDLGAYPGGYFGEAGFSLEQQLHPAVVLEASVSQSFGSKAFNRAYWDVSRSLLNAGFLRISLTWSFGGGFFLRSRIEEAVLTGRPIREAAGRGSFFNFGLALGLEQ